MRWMSYPELLQHWAEADLTARAYELTWAGTQRPGNLNPVMVFREREGDTLILLEEKAAAAGLSSAFPSRMITLNIHSSLDAVGFLAAITTRLAAAGMGVNPVSAYFHDHLFVPAERADEAIAILKGIVNENCD